ncbi:bifunctional endoribonuclease/protein kinase ire1 [Maublancomyces gigas]|uniref:Bifunctional endoribonuclease/protein kinase ire1 n=1 Tax=Discina gigas TaxID=1032678 RepID=A0ABR3GG46_9PEZI
MPTLARETLKINDRVLVYKYKLLGSKGGKGVVYKGRYGKDIVAVKEIFKHGDADTDEETDQYILLRHSNVVGYRCVQETAHFRYIVMELCQGSLIDIEAAQGLTREIGAKELLRQIADGVGHIHSLGILHWGLKPSNVLISLPDIHGKRRAVISDIGGSRIERPVMTQDMSKGRSVWRAPEVLNPNSQQFLGPATDIFSMGCVFYFVLTCGGDLFTADDKPSDLSSLVEWGDDNNREDLNEECYASLGGTVERKELWNWNGYEAEDLIGSMTDNEPSKRPHAHGVMNHPFFWKSRKRLDFLELVSDCLQQEGDETEPTSLLTLLENGVSDIIGDNWLAKLDTDDFSKTLHKPPEGQKEYDPTRLEQLLRVIRNTVQHLDQFDSAAQSCIGKSPPEVLFYFTDRFPCLLMHVYCVIGKIWKYEGVIPEEPNFGNFYTSNFEGVNFGGFDGSVGTAVSIQPRERSETPKTLKNTTRAMEFALYVLSVSFLTAGWLGDGRRFATFMVLSASAAIYGVIIRWLRKKV